MDDAGLPSEAWGVRAFRRYYDQRYRAKHAGTITRAAFFRAIDGLASVGFASRMSGAPRRGRVVDAGAGEAPYRSLLAHTLIACDISLEALRWSARPAACADLAELPFAPESFDQAWCFETLEHLPRSREEVALRELHAALRPGGHLFVSVPSDPLAMPALLAAVDRRFSGAGHLRVYTPADLQEKLQGAGFSGISIYHFGHHLLAAVLLAERSAAARRMIGSRFPTGRLARALASLASGLVLAEALALRRSPGLRIFATARRGPPERSSTE